jgi:hypothetical protein
MMSGSPPTVDDLLMDESERGGGSGTSAFSSSFNDDNDAQDSQDPVSSVELSTLHKNNTKGHHHYGVDDTETSEGTILPPTSAASLPTPEDYGMDAGTYLNRKQSGGRRRMALIGAAICLVCLVLVLGVSLGVAGNRRRGSSNSSRADKQPRTPASSRSEMVQWVTDAGISPLQAVSTAGTPQYKAIEYLLQRRTVVPQSTNLNVSNNNNTGAYLYAAKYVLAVLFYATAGDTNWASSLRFLQDDDFCDWNAFHPAVGGGGKQEVTLAGVGCDRTGLPLILDLGTCVRDNAGSVVHSLWTLVLLLCFD